MKKVYVHQPCPGAERNLERKCEDFKGNQGASKKKSNKKKLLWSKREGINNDRPLLVDSEFADYLPNVRPGRNPKRNHVTIIETWIDKRVDRQRWWRAKIANIGSVVYFNRNTRPLCFDPGPTFPTEALRIKHSIANTKPIRRSFLCMRVSGLFLLDDWMVIGGLYLACKWLNYRGRLK